MSDPFCCEVARQEGGSLGGTAPRAAAWLLLEHPGRWGARAVDEDLPPAVARWVEAQLAGLGAARALLVRQAEERRTPVSCFLAFAGEERGELYRLAVGSLEHLLPLDLPAAVAAGELAPYRLDERLALVCTNARRDRCCARLGVPTFRALAERLGAGVWQSTHQGGHRHAATALWLPEGVAYGFLTPDDVDTLVAARERGALLLPRFRGRTFHPAPAQAADALLRAELGEERLDAWRLEHLAEEPGGRWQVVFAGSRGRFRVTVERASTEALVSCSPAKRKPIDRFALAGWERLDEPP